MTLKTLALPITLAAALTVAPLATAGPGDDNPKTSADQLSKDMKELKESLDKLREQLKSVEGVRRDVDILKDTVKKMDVTLDLMTQNNKVTTTQLMEGADGAAR